MITNTKGFTGHAMGAGIEDVVAVKALETGIVPPVPNYREPDPDLGTLNLSNGGQQPVRYALRLAAGFGSQIAMALLRWTPMPDGQRRGPDQLGYSYRIVDPPAWQRWLDRLAGRDGAIVEVDHRRLRIVDTGCARACRSRLAVPVPYASRLGRVDATVAAAPTAAPPSPAAPAPAAPTPAAPSPTPAPVAAAPSVDEVLAAVTAIVAEMTGYPADLLDPDLDLEADLGVDTVKQAEVFAAVREHYDVERDDNLQLRDFPTLRHVADWVRDKAGLPERGRSDADGSQLRRHPSRHRSRHPMPTRCSPQVTAIVAEMTGYPADLLDPTSTSKPTSASTPSNKPRSSPQSASTTTSNATTTSNSATSPPSATSPTGSATKPASRTRHRSDRSRPHAAAAAAPAAAAPAAATPSTDEVLAAVTAVVAEMTGYPADLLEPDLDLEADLGVDTVKQAEVFAAVREHYDVERDDNLQLRDFPTLNHVADWVRDKAGLPAPTTAAAAAPAAATASTRHPRRAGRTGRPTRCWPR